MPKRSRGPHLKWRADRQVWEIIEYAGGKRLRNSTGFSCPKEAQKFLGEYIANRKPEDDGPNDPASRLIGDVIASYADERGQFLKSQKTFEKCAAALLEFWGEKPCRFVREETCRQYHTHRDAQFKAKKKTNKDRTIKPSVVARELSVLSAALMHDYRAGRLTLPVPVWKPKFDNRKDVWLTPSEAARLIRAARAHDRARGYLPLFILLGLYTAARHAALLDLKWPQVDLDRGLIDLNPRGQERTAKGKPMIPIPRRLMTHLRYAKKKGEPFGAVIHENNRPFKSLKKTYGEAVKRAGLRGVTPHTLRHTAASWMVQRGVAFPVVARYLGHADSRTTERIYAHHNPDYLSAAAKSLDNRPVTATKIEEQIMKKPKTRTKSAG